MNIFVDKNDLVEVEVYTWVDKENIASTSSKTDVPKGIDAQILKFYFRKPNYKDSQTIAKMAMVNGQIDAVSFQEAVLRQLIAKWDITVNDEEVPFSVANIDNLAPDVARSAVAGALDKISI